MSSWKVLFVPLWYPQPNSKSVDGTFCREHVLAVSQYCDITVVHLKTNAGMSPGNYEIEKTIDHGVATYRIKSGISPIPKTTWIYSRRNLFNALTRIIEDCGPFDLIHTQDAMSLWISAFAKQRQLPYVISQHWTGFLRKAVPWYQINRYRRAFNSAKFVLPANYRAKQDYEYYNIKCETIHLPNTFDPKLFYVNDQCREDALLHASGFTPQKRFPDIIEAFKLLLRSEPSAFLHVVGDGPGRHGMQELAAQALPEDRYIFHGHLAKSGLSTLMRKVKGFVLPSDNETFGCVLMESMACGTPVITARVGGIPGVVDEGDGLFVTPGDIQGITKAMEMLISGDLKITSEQLARKTYGRFSYPKIGRLLCDIYNEALQ